MNYTTNFNLNKPEGTDLYNHLTIDNPNMDIIDAAMQVNKLASIGAATELVSGTVHAITRSDSNQNVFKFKATGDFKAGDTVTVDGVSVNAYTTGGQQLLDDAYVLSAEVIGILDGTNLWILSNKVPDGTEIAYDNVDSVNSKIDKIGDIHRSQIVLSNGQNLFIDRVGYICIARYTNNTGDVVSNISANLPNDLKPYGTCQVVSPSCTIYVNTTGNVQINANAWAGNVLVYTTA